MAQDATPDTSNTSSDPRIDRLSGLANRVSLQEQLSRLAPWEPGTTLTLLAVEMSRFGSLNDGLGATLGDKVIATIARRLGKVFAHAAMLARTHGDHFCLVFAGDVDLDEQVRLLEDFAQRPLAVRGEVIVLSVRVGIASLSSSLRQPAQLLHAAEVALHRAKRDGLKRCSYATDLEEQAKASHRLENDLRVSLVTRHVELHQAISNDEFRILYQPIVDVERGGVHALEALIRWQHPTRGLISPAAFIPTAEKIQVMDVLGQWILRRACSDAAGLPRDVHGGEVGISVNVSPTQFVEPQLLLGAVRQALRESGIEASRLKLEITESTAFGANMASTIEALRELGCRIALDDFGTGYSSLTQLNAIALDYLKLDRSFIVRLAGDDPREDERADRLTRALLSIAQAFGITPIIEGVETAAQLERLRHHGARLMQGYYFARPMPIEQAAEFIRGHAQPPGT